MDHSENI